MATRPLAVLGVCAALAACNADVDLTRAGAGGQGGADPGPDPDPDACAANATRESCCASDECGLLRPTEQNDPGCISQDRICFFKDCSDNVVTTEECEAGYMCMVRTSSGVPNACDVDPEGGCTGARGYCIWTGP
jgi:hypothetical protein